MNQVERLAWYRRAVRWARRNCSRQAMRFRFARLYKRRVNPEACWVALCDWALGYSTWGDAVSRSVWDSFCHAPGGGFVRWGMGYCGMCATTEARDLCRRGLPLRDRAPKPEVELLRAEAHEAREKGEGDG